MLALCVKGYDKEALSEQVFGNTSCDGSQFGKLPCEVDSEELLDEKRRKFCINVKTFRLK